MKRLLAVAASALLFGSLSLLPTYASQTSPQYTVTVPEQDKRLAKIEVRFSPKTDTILMYPEGANHLPDGWATFVRSLVAKTDAGAVIPLQYLGQARWKVSEPLPQNINLSYEILIHHDQGRWPFGHDEAAYAKRDCVFYTGASLFIGTLDFENIGVQFNVPSGWHVSTPWKEIAGKQNAFSVSGVEELINVGMLVGEHIERSVKIGNLEVVLAVGQDLKESVDLFEASIKPLVPAAIIPFFSHPPEIRRVIYTTNAFQELNMSLRKVTKARGSFPNDEAIQKLLYLALRNIAKKWTMPIHDWKAALNRFAILYEDRLPMN